MKPDFITVVIPVGVPCLSRGVEDVARGKRRIKCGTHQEQQTL